MAIHAAADARGDSTMCVQALASVSSKSSLFLIALPLATLYSNQPLRKYSGKPLPGAGRVGERVSSRTRSSPAPRLQAIKECQPCCAAYVTASKY